MLTIILGNILYGGSKQMSWWIIITLVNVQHHLQTILKRALPKWRIEFEISTFKHNVKIRVKLFFL